MKRGIVLAVATVSIVALSLTANAETRKTTFKVSGNCGLCEKKIETAAKSVKGVVMADWDKETQEIKLTYDTDKTNLDNIHKAIAKVGYDTDKVKASDLTYSKLPSCCKYDR